MGKTRDDREMWRPDTIDFCCSFYFLSFVRTKHNCHTICVIVLNTQSQEMCGHVILMRICTSRRRKKEERETHATWR